MVYPSPYVLILQYHESQALGMLHHLRSMRPYSIRSPDLQRWESRAEMFSNLFFVRLGCSQKSISVLDILRTSQDLPSSASAGKHIGLRYIAKQPRLAVSKLVASHCRLKTTRHIVSWCARPVGMPLQHRSF